MQGSRSRGRGAISSGILTGISTAVVSGSAAAAGVILSRKFGHGVKTDGFFAAYPLYLAIVLVASVVRVVALPRFVRAAADRRLAGEAGAWTAAVAGPLLVVVVVAIAWPDGLASALTSEPGARHYAAELLPWAIASAAAQVLGGLAASALGALDDYATAAFGFALGSVAGLVVTITLIGHGLIAFGWGLGVNGAVSLLVPLAVLARRGGVGLPDMTPWPRLVELLEGVTLPVALQLLFVVANRFASGLGSGDATTFSYAYLIAAFFVSLTATSLALVTTVPYAREGESPERSGRHVVSASWLSLVPIAAASGVFAVAGATISERVLGPKYGGATGDELSRLVVYLAPWMVASVALTIAYPLLFVRGRARWLPLVALGALALHVPLEWGLRAAWGLGGLAAGLAATTALVLAVLLAALHALQMTTRGVVVAAVICGALAAAAFGLPRIVLGPIAAAVVGLVLDSAALALLRPAGLRQAWAYVHGLQ
jgi:O-antigen/teichoic acid export membrane protein